MDEDVLRQQGFQTHFALGFRKRIYFFVAEKP